MLNIEYRDDQLEPLVGMSVRDAAAALVKSEYPNAKITFIMRSLLTITKDLRGIAESGRLQMNGDVIVGLASGGSESEVIVDAVPQTGEAVSEVKSSVSADEAAAMNLLGVWDKIATSGRTATVVLLAQESGLSTDEVVRLSQWLKSDGYALPDAVDVDIPAVKTKSTPAPVMEPSEAEVPTDGSLARISAWQWADACYTALRDYSTTGTEDRWHVGDGAAYLLNRRYGKDGWELENAESREVMPILFQRGVKFDEEKNTLTLPKKDMPPKTRKLLRDIKGSSADIKTPALWDMIVAVLGEAPADGLDAETIEQQVRDRFSWDKNVDTLHWILETFVGNGMTALVDGRYQLLQKNEAN